MKRKSIVIGIIIIIVGVLLTFMLTRMKKPLEESKVYESKKYVQTEVVEYTNLEGRIDAMGRVAADKIVDIFPEVSGHLLPASQKFKEGVYFSSGDVMLEIDSEEARLNLLAQKSDFLNILTMIMPDLKADFPEAYPKWLDYLQNYDIKQPIKAIPEASSDKEKYFISNRNVYKLYYSIKNSELRLSKHTIRAPFNCVVTQSFANPGMLTSPGQKLGQVQSTSNYELKLDVSPDEASYIKTGDRVKVYNKSEELAGKVLRIGKKIDERSQTVAVYVAVSGRDILDGMYLKGVIQADSLRNAFPLQRKALYNGEYVFTAVNEKLEKRKVEIERIGSEYAYIRGIEPGIQIITEPLVNPIVGQKVIPISKKMK